jgi:drug/metabolite transporter (DMT)-like permease
MGVTGTLWLPALTIQAMVVSLVYGLLFLIISYLLLVGFQKTDINIGSMLVSTELFFGPLFAYLMFKESLTTPEIIGSILVIIAVININRKK